MTQIIYANKNNIITSLEKYKELAIGRSDYSEISERYKADGNRSLTKNLNKLNNPQYSMGKRRYQENMSFPSKILEGPQDQGAGES